MHGKECLAFKEVKVKMKVKMMRRSIALAVACIALNACAEGVVVSAADCGFSPEAEPAANAAALQRALDGGRRTVRVAKGVYRLDRNVYVDSGTTLVCEPGTVFVKTRPYAHVLANRALASGGRDRDIAILGLEVRVNGQEAYAAPDSPAPGLRAHLAFVHVDNLRIADFACNDLAKNCYCMQIADFDGVTVERFGIRGQKDGIHLNDGRRFVIRDGRLRTGDDGIALNAGDWPSCTPRLGSLEDGVIENVVDEPGGRCNFVRVITGVWTDWHPGMRLQREDVVRVGKRVYCVFPAALSTNEYVSTAAPGHGRGVWTSPDGISFLYLQDNGATRADIRNVVIRNCRIESDRCVTCLWEICEWARLIHPEIPLADYPETSFRLENVVKTGRGPLIGGNSSVSATLVNCRAAGRFADMNFIRGYPTVRTFVAKGCPGADEKDAFASSDPRGTVTRRTEGCPARADAAEAPADYLVVDVSDGPQAMFYPVEKVSAAAAPDFRDRLYKTDRIVLRRIPAGTHAAEPGATGRRISGTLTTRRDCWVAIYPVTQGQWRNVMGENPAFWCVDSPDDVRGLAAERPVDVPSWNHIRGMIEPVQAVTAFTPDSFLQRLVLKTGKAGFDLPTEAQWEIAARAGADGAWGSCVSNGVEVALDERNLALAAWHAGNAPQAGTKPVGSLCPNRWGFFDMAGNLLEWCRDAYVPTFQKDRTDEPCVDTSYRYGWFRVLRGGGNADGADACRLSRRHFYWAGGSDYSIGFRIAFTDASRRE